MLDHCRGSTRQVFDQCSRVCECDNNRLVKCSRLRRDWADLNTEEKSRYIEAVKTAANHKLYKPRYDALVKQYAESFDTDVQVTEPSISQFIPYNRSVLIVIALLHSIMLESIIMLYISLIVVGIFYYNMKTC